MLEGLGLKTSFLWKPYDPNHFITLRRVKYRLSSYDHVRLPHIEKYANQTKWKRGTLDEPITQEKLNERARRNLLKMADLELPTQVFALTSTQVGAAASSSTAHQKAVKATDQTSSKGKEKEMELEQPLQEKVQQQEAQQQQQVQQQEQEEPMQGEHTAEAPMVTEQQPPQIVPPRQETRSEASILQTPQKEDISF